MPPVSADEFKAICLDLLERVSAGEVGELAITRDGDVVASLQRPRLTVAQSAESHGFMRGMVDIPDDFDLTAPVWENHAGPE